MEWLEKIRKWTQQWISRIHFGRDTGIFLFFLALSTLFWLVNQLGKDTSAEIDFPVQFKNDLPDRFIFNDLPDRLTLLVKGQGYTLMKYKLKPRLKPLTIDIRSFPLRQVTPGNKRKFYLLSSYIQGMVNDQLGQHLVLANIRPDTLYFIFDSLVKRKLPVHPEVKITLARQYILKKPMQVIPDSVMVSGPALILDTLPYITTEYAEFNNVTESFRKILPVKKVAKINIPVKKVEIRAEVEQFTEVVFKIPVEKINVPDTLHLFLFPSLVKVTFHVGLSRYKKVMPELFTARVDYRDVLKDRSGKIRVYLVKKPDYIDAVRVDPERVEYLIEKIK